MDSGQRSINAIEKEGEKEPHDETASHLLEHIITLCHPSSATRAPLFVFFINKSTIHYPLSRYLLVVLRDSRNELHCAR